VRHEWGRNADADVAVRALLSELEAAKQAGQRARAKSIRGKLRGQYGYYISEQDSNRGNIAESIRVSVEESRRQVRSAAQQLERAHARMQAARHRAHERMAQRRQQRRRKDFAGGFNPGMGLALLFFAAVAVGSVLVVGRGAMSIRPRGVTHRDQIVHGVLPPPAPAAPVIPASDQQEDGRFRTELRAGGDLPALPPVDGTVLVVSDLTPPLAPDVQERLSAALERVRAAGMTVYGEDAGEDQVDLESQVRSVRALLPLESGEAAELIGTWLAQSHGVDAVLWWAPGVAAGDAPRFALYQPQKAGGERSADDELRRAALVRAITGE
jgi:hypothetical protein